MHQLSAIENNWRLQGGDKNPMPATPDNCTWNVTSIENVGREAHSFATHLVERYGSLAPYTIFTQVCLPVLAQMTCLKTSLTA